MKLLGALPLLLLVCHGAAANIEEAVDMIFAYSVYELDFLVHLPAKGIVARNCTGRGTNGKCMFDEFAKYVTDGEVGNLPDMGIGGEWIPTPASIATFAKTLSESYKAISKSHRVIENRLSYTGMWSDLGYAVENGRVLGAQKKINTERLSHNIGQVHKVVRDYRLVAAHTRASDYLRKNVKDVLWSTVTNKDVGKPSDWQQIEWDKTIKDNPDMANPRSELFKKVSKELEKHLSTTKELEARSISAQLAANIDVCT